MKRATARVEEAHHVLDVTFVDDECIMLAADDSRSLADAIDCCTLVLSTTFQLLKLEVNLAPWEDGVPCSDERKTGSRHRRKMAT